MVPVEWSAPTFTATAVGGNYIEYAGSAGTSLFSGAVASTIETGQAIKSLSFTVSNVLDGASEQINIDGSTISLVAGSGTTTTKKWRLYGFRSRVV